ncbi:Murein DD-endopeptidase MepM [Planctomycetaceae bacterium]|nr:Murein DD-endopeptidase MepM [Planctomycetaceae bacterium]
MTVHHSGLNNVNKRFILPALLLVLGAILPLSVQAQEGGVNTATPTRLATNTRPAPTTPTATFTPFPTFTPAPTQISTLIPGAFGGDAATWTPPPPANIYDGHFLFRRPFSEDQITYWARSYSYGSTSLGSLRVHHGLDFPNPGGTAILAAADGVVYYAGQDVERLFGPQPDFYGTLVVIEHPFMYASGLKIYTLYGHMREVSVQTGDAVTAGEIIGYVGSSGVAAGAHLHFEVRIGEPENYSATRNPELWLQPYPNTGVVIGRVLDTLGKPLEAVMVEIKSPGVYFQAWTYSGFSVNGDLQWNENFVIPDAPAGYHTITITGADNLIRYRNTIYVEPGKVTFVTANIQP